MKTLIGAISLVLAVPAAAQTAPAADHSVHKGMDHSQHQSGKHDCMDCCKKMKGKDGKTYAQRSAICLETQHYPDSVNHPNFPSIILEPGKTYRHTTVFVFSAE